MGMKLGLPFRGYDGDKKCCSRAWMGNGPKTLELLSHRQDTNKEILTHVPRMAQRNPPGRGLKRVRHLEAGHRFIDRGQRRSRRSQETHGAAWGRFPVSSQGRDLLFHPRHPENVGRFVTRFELIFANVTSLSLFSS